MPGTAAVTPTAATDGIARRDFQRGAQYELTRRPLYLEDPGTGSN